MPTSENAGGSGPKPFRRSVSGRLLRFRYCQQQVPGRRYATSFDTGNIALYSNAIGRVLMLPTRSRWPLIPQAFETQFRPRGLCGWPHSPQRELVPRSNPLQLETLVVKVLDVHAILLLGHPLLKHSPVRPLGALFDRRLLHVPAPVPYLRRLPLSNPNRLEVGQREVR
jgi:hypothetical protein